jgi:hypothetical protein
MNDKGYFSQYDIQILSKVTSMTNAELREYVLSLSDSQQDYIASLVAAAAMSTMLGDTDWCTEEMHKNALAADERNRKEVAIESALNRSIDANIQSTFEADQLLKQFKL